jgi:hypothetical protein
MAEHVDAGRRRTAPASVEHAVADPGRPLPHPVRAAMEARFASDFTGVRVHADDAAAASAHDVGAAAYTVGRHVVFGTGRFAPGTTAGLELLAHELTHVVQQGGADAPGTQPLTVGPAGDPAEHQADGHAGPVARSRPPLVQRREREDGTAESRMGQGDWTTADRVAATERWKKANLYNLTEQRPHEYTQPHERRDFYLWVYNHTVDLGFETRWPLAAYVVAGGAAQLSYGVPFDNAVQVAARRGNQVIFDDVFPKLRDLVSGPKLTGKAARDWDAKTLSEEQTLVQAMYEDTPAATVDEFAGYAKQKGALATAGGFLGFAKPQRGGSHHRVKDIPPFTGDIRSVDERFDYGISLADEFSTLPPSGRIPRPPAGAGYESGAEFRRLDTRIGLHRLDAELDDFDVDEAAVITCMQALTADEQRELGYNRQRLRFIVSALDTDEIDRALKGLDAVPADVRAFLRGKPVPLLQDVPRTPVPARP